MEDPQEFKSVDDLFRRTFEDLPDTSSATGWDTPSPKVWEHVQSHLQPPASGWSGKAILLISGFALVLMLGLYWAFSRTGKPDSNGQTPVESGAIATNPQQPIPPAPMVDDDKNEGAVSVATTDTKPGQSAITHQTPDQMLAKQATTDNPLLADEEAIRQRTVESAPLPGTAPASPNTTIRRQVEALQRAPWAQPLAPLPGYLDGTTIRPVPESLKKLIEKN